MIAEPKNNVDGTTAKTVPILEERLSIGTRLVETGHATVKVSVSEQEKTVEALLMRQDISIERVPVGTMVPFAPIMRQEGDIVIIPILEERLVTEKKLFLVEELRIRIQESSHVKQYTATLRTEHAEVATNYVNTAKEAL